MALMDLPSTYPTPTANKRIIVVVWNIRRKCRQKLWASLGGRRGIGRYAVHPRSVSSPRVKVTVSVARLTAPTNHPARRHPYQAWG